MIKKSAITEVISLISLMIHDTKLSYLLYCNIMLAYQYQTLEVASPETPSIILKLFISYLKPIILQIIPEYLAQA